LAIPASRVEKSAIYDAVPNTVLVVFVGVRAIVVRLAVYEET